ncbi:uncharacterized protein LOC142319766 isoform X2 [Lycorma delicatula]|uniref:uncharacterized protein LOC142319766 isoform X2 n=1 Tax=Lycorma delicatula TaxID=130591 RepID=UPI003F51052D
MIFYCYPYEYYSILSSTSKYNRYKMCVLSPYLISRVGVCLLLPFMVMLFFFNDEIRRCLPYCSWLNKPLWFKKSLLMTRANTPLEIKPHGFYVLNLENYTSIKILERFKRFEDHLFMHAGVQIITICEYGDQKPVHSYSTCKKLAKASRTTIRNCFRG